MKLEALFASVMAINKLDVSPLLGWMSCKRGSHMAGCVFRPAPRVRWKRGVAGVGVAALAAGSLEVGGASTASAAPAAFNPFDVNSGFTIVSQGDIVLGNAEIEGSVASFGAISSGNANGYPVVHKVAGQADYTVPVIDGDPVRILADRFTGAGSFDISNRDDSGTIAAGSPEANAVAKLDDTTGLTGSARGGGSGNAAGGAFLRVTNQSNGNLDLKTVPFAGSDVDDVKTIESSVAAYFPGMDALVAQTNQCLTLLYDPGQALMNTVSVEDQGGMVFVEGFATDRPNVIDYADIAGKTVKLDRADGYQPTADAPLVIRVAPATTSLGQLRFEGWSSHASAQQSLARYILLDLSEVTGSVTVDGLELGAIWAPNVDLSFNSGVTTNGQWFARSVSTAGGGEIHHHDFLGKLPCVEDPVTPVDPAIGTTVAVTGSDAKVLPVTGGTV
ncbi:collagen-binding domain-containing protein, partial [Prescottella equi]|uniref:collagen-binding domain-containing protein n=1 Tax=Rhodococcus hoagii TaxID=43767 RepID=UPI00301BAF2D